jgi:hypothetical protein
MRPHTRSSQSASAVEKLCVGQLTTRFGSTVAEKLNEMHCGRPPSICGDFAAEARRDARCPERDASSKTSRRAHCGERSGGPFRPTRQPRRHLTTHPVCGGPASGRETAELRVRHPVIALRQVRSTTDISSRGQHYKSRFARASRTNCDTRPISAGNAVRCEPPICSCDYRHPFSTTPATTEHFRRGPLFQRTMNPILRMRRQSWAAETTQTHSFDDGASVRAQSGRPKRAERETHA